MAETAPWFKMHPRDWLSDFQVRMLTPATRSALMDLRCLQWIRGEIPEGDELRRWLTMQGYDCDEIDLDQLLELFPDGADPNLTEQRDAIAAKKERLSRAGRKGAKKRWRNSKSDKDVIATPKPGHSEANGEASREAIASRSRDADAEADTEAETSTSTSTDTSLRSVSAAAGGEKASQGELIEVPPGTKRQITAQVLVGAWIDLQPHQPSKREIAKQAGVAKRICDDYDDEAIHNAINGMSKLFPHSEGAPWDLLILERKFSLAVQAAVAEPPDGPTTADRRLMEHRKRLEDVDL